MRISTILFIALTGVFTLSACEKDEESQLDCQDLKEGIITANVERVKVHINYLINGLTSRSHTPKNLASLISAINSRCSIASPLSCFKCVDTLPEQSEIRISISTPNGEVLKTIDISSDANGKMICGNMHD